MLNSKYDNPQPKLVKHWNQITDHGFIIEAYTFRDGLYQIAIFKDGSGLEKWVPTNEATFWLTRMEASSTTASSGKWTTTPELNTKQVFLEWHDEGEIDPFFNYDREPSLSLECWMGQVLEKICQANGYLAKEEFSRLLKTASKTKKVTV